MKKLNDANTNYKINLIEYLIAFIVLITICFIVNKGIVLKGLFMDDLYSWSWFRGINIFEYAFKFYEGSSKYRPFYEALQYIIHALVDTAPTRYTFINKILNSLTGLFIYFFSRKLKSGKLTSILISTLYIVGHYAYYQIGQAIGVLETASLTFSIITLYYAVKLTGLINEDNKKRTLKELNLNAYIMFLFYFITVFTHERFLGIAAPMFFAILFLEKYDKAKDKDIKNLKIKYIIIFFVEIIIILGLRMIAIGKVVPAGTGGTNVEETFKISECIKYCFDQVKMVFGINIGPDYLFGIDFVSIKNPYIKISTYISMIIVIITFIFYIIKKIKNDKNFIMDLLLLSFIAVCIGASSVTIRVELRFVYVSFVGALLYLSYIIAYLSDAYENSDKSINIKILSRRSNKNNINKKYDNKIRKNIFICNVKLLPLLLALLFFITRLPIELEYRKHYDKIYCYVDMKRMNSLYDNTIGKYGVDDTLHNKKIWVQNNFYGMTKFYSEYFFKIYDKENIGNTINLYNVITEVDLSDPINTIVLEEDFPNNEYKEYIYIR